MFGRATPARVSWDLWYSIVPLLRGCPSCSYSLQGNKGATAIRLEFTPKSTSDPPITTYRSTVLTFVNAHLAALDEMVERRNYDFQELSGRLVFSSSGFDRSYLPTSFAGDTYSAYQSDVLFWMVRSPFPGNDIAIAHANSSREVRFSSQTKDGSLHVPLRSQLPVRLIRRGHKENIVLARIRYRQHTDPIIVRPA